jgi:integrase
MSLYRRKGSPSWWYDFTVDGARFRGSTGAEGKREAKAVEDERKAEARKRPRYSANWKLRYIFGAYWNDHAVGLPSAKTIEYQLAELSDGLGRDTLATKLTAAMLIAYRAKRRGKGLSDASINREFVLLRAALNHAAGVHHQAVPKLDWGKLKVKEPPGRVRFLEFEEYARLLDLAHPAIRPVMICAATTGLRKGNILALDWMQVQLGSRMIQVLMKGNRRHGVRIVPQLMAVLSATPQTERKGKVFDGTNFEKRWRTALKDAGITDFKFHDLRHTFASWARQNGADIADVSEALGHTTVQMTMRYAHIKPDAQDTAFDRVSAALTAQSTSHRLQKARI